MNKEHITKITRELKLTEKQVSATGSLDETIITTIRKKAKSGT